MSNYILLPIPLLLVVVMLTIIVDYFLQTLKMGKFKIYSNLKFEKQTRRFKTFKMCYREAKKKGKMPSVGYFQLVNSQFIVKDLDHLNQHRSRTT